MKPLLNGVNPLKLAAVFMVLPTKNSGRPPGGRAGGRFWPLMVTGLLLLLTAFLPLSAQPAILWDKTYGGNANDYLPALQQTNDGGYILGGSSESGISGDKTEANRGDCFGTRCTADYWVVKLDAAGNKQWDKTYGGNDNDYLSALQQTSDGGYILGGQSLSDISGDKTEATLHFPDYWVVKLDAAGNKVWDKTLKGGGDDRFTTLQQTLDGGYLLGGYSTSDISGDKTEANKGGFDYWVVKLDAAGNKQWDKTYGGNANDYLSTLQQTNDGGYLLGGRSESGISGNKTEANRAGCLGTRCTADYWVVKLDAVGNKQWDKTLGGNRDDGLNALQQTNDGGYILGGYSSSGISGDKTEANRSVCSDITDFNCPADYWVVKLDAAGNKQWDKTLGGDGVDGLNALQQTNDGGFILGGISGSPISGDKTEASKDIWDYWVVKLDTAGNKQWDKTIGGNGVDGLSAIHQTRDGGFILGGYSDSPISGDKTEASKGGNDYWVIKLSPFLREQVGSFTLINAETGQSFQILHDGDSINLADLPSQKLNIRASTNPVMVGSIRFELSGQQTRIYQDNAAPYALFGDTTGKYNAWSPEPGSYTLAATPYSQPDAQGEAGTPLTIHFTLFSKQVGPQVEWDKTLGGTSLDDLAALRQTNDGGYILGGTSRSPISGDKTEANRRDCLGTRCTADYWVVKLDAAGNKQWDKTFGNSGDEVLYDLQQTTDRGYILSGYSYSDIGGDKTEASKGGNDYWVVKLDAAGNKQWDKTIGGAFTDYGTSLLQTNDGGYLLGGYSFSDISSDKTEASKGRFDYWVVKLDAAGNKVWDKGFGGNEDDYLYALQQTRDGGYLLGGYSSSGIGGDKTEANRSVCSDITDINCSADYWVVRLDAAGNKVWDKTYGGNRGDILNAIQQTRDGGYLLGGYSSSGIGGDKTEANRSVCSDITDINCSADYWVVRLDAAGNKVWDKTLGGSGFDFLHSLEQISDGGYLLGGSSNSGMSEDKTQASKGGDDYWVVKLNAAGEKQWDKTIGGDYNDGLIALQQTPEGGYILGGNSESPISGNKTEVSRGDYDYWAVKLAPFSAGEQQVNSFTLINTQSELPIRTLQDGDILLLADLPKKLNIRADTDPATVGSVQFTLSGQQERSYLDNQVPYALFGDVRGDYNKWYPAPGSYRLTATPYSERNAQGQAGTPLTIRFTVVSKQAASLAARMEQVLEPVFSLMLYPNPTADGRLQVRLTGQEPGPVRYRLLSSTGRKLAEGTITHAGNLLELDFSRQLRAPGLYYLRLEGTHVQQTFRIMHK